MLKGVLLAILSNLLFGLGYYFAILFQPLTDMQMFGLRIVVVLPFILLAILLFSQQRAFKELLQKIRRKPPLVAVLLLLAANSGVQLWLFLWAPNNNQALQVSIGYLLLPIVSVALGKLVFKEQFTPLKWASLAFAVIGVGSNIWLSSAISWATFVAGFGYPIYIVLRRYFQINHLATLFVELLLCLPFALHFASQVDFSFVQSQNPQIYWYLALFGLVNGIAFMSYISSSNLLPMNILGMIGYLEPLVMLSISFAIGEVLEAKAYILMICLAISIFLLCLDGFRKRR
ncbi:EamA family transporter RarD [Frederiksenia canicola]|uniref:Chloramphenicol-sensitive protein RarD n=1 Tax=Frederiksenia canicola TaxID=123824 RepID=A0ABX9XTK3_9PAST|nr:EamA family transporter RarD [Frederiksenia canicola]RPE95743.1 chloramphenicol-sensitive protein RarD [Frederiksenia canicola]